MLSTIFGSARDGARVIAQSNQARSLWAELSQQKAVASTREYIQQIEQRLYQSTNLTKDTPDESDPQQPRQSVQPAPQQATSANSGAISGAKSQLQFPDFSPPAATGENYRDRESGRDVGDFTADLGRDLKGVNALSTYVPTT